MTNVTEGAVVFESGLLASLPDETLVRRAQRGDAAAFDAIVERHAPALLRFVGRTLPERGECDDVIQETLIAAWKALPDFAFRSSLRTWLFSIASRKSADVLRRRRKHAALSSEVHEVAALEPGPAQRATDSDFLAALSRELELLPYTARTAWWLREVEGFSTVEIAAVLRTSEGSVRGHLQRTRRRLAQAMDGYRP